MAAVARVVHVFSVRCWMLGYDDESALYALMYGTCTR